MSNLISTLPNTYKHSRHQENLARFPYLLFIRTLIDCGIQLSGLNVLTLRHLFNQGADLLRYFVALKLSAGECEVSATVNI